MAEHYNNYGTTKLFELFCAAQADESTKMSFYIFTGCNVFLYLYSLPFFGVILKLPLGTDL